MADALRFLDDFTAALWIALAVAAAVLVLAVASRILGPVVRWIEVRVLPAVARRSRLRHGLPAGAPPWACAGCGSVNVPTAAGCYHCGAPRTEDAHELREAAADPTVFHRPPPPNQFDPSRYRGPGAPRPADEADAREAPFADGPREGDVPAAGRPVAPPSSSP